MPANARKADVGVAKENRLNLSPGSNVDISYTRSDHTDGDVHIRFIVTGRLAQIAWGE